MSIYLSVWNFFVIVLKGFTRPSFIFVYFCASYKPLLILNYLCVFRRFFLGLGGVTLWAILPPTPARLGLLALFKPCYAGAQFHIAPLGVALGSGLQSASVLPPCMHDAVTSLSGTSDLACRCAPDGIASGWVYLHGGGRNRRTANSHNFTRLAGSARSPFWVRCIYSRPLCYFPI